MFLDKIRLCNLIFNVWLSVKFFPGGSRLLQKAMPDKLSLFSLVCQSTDESGARFGWSSEKYCVIVFITHFGVCLSCKFSINGESVCMCITTTAYEITNQMWNDRIRHVVTFAIVQVCFSASIWQRTFCGWELAVQGIRSQAHRSVWSKCVYLVFHLTNLAWTDSSCLHRWVLQDNRRFECFPKDHSFFIPKIRLANISNEASS